MYGGGFYVSKVLLFRLSSAYYWHHAAGKLSYYVDPASDPHWDRRDWTWTGNLFWIVIFSSPLPYASYRTYRGGNTMDIAFQEKFIDCLQEQAVEVLYQEKRRS